MNGGRKHPGGPAKESLVPACHGLAGFSMLEMLITVALILILTTMYWHSSSGDRPRLRNACQQNLQKLYVALQIYSNDSGGKFPDVPRARSSEEALDVLVPRYDSDTSIFICPASGNPALPRGVSIAKGKVSYAYYMGRHPAGSTEALMSDAQVDTQAKAPGQLVFSDTGKAPGNNHQKSGGNLMFCDGHTQWTPSQASFSLSLTQGVTLLNPRP